MEYRQRIKIENLVFFVKMIAFFMGIFLLIMLVIHFIVGHKRRLPFEHELSFQTDYVYRDENGQKTDPYDFRWYTVSETPPTKTGAYSIYSLYDPDYQLDFEKYTYIIVNGCTLKNLYYYPYPIKVHKLDGYTKYSASVELGLDCSPSSINVYRTPKMWLDSPVKGRHTDYAALSEKIIK